MFGIPFTTTQEVLINKPIKDVYEAITNLDIWKQWSPWLHMEPTAKTKTENPWGVMGHTQSWDGDLIGAGRMTLGTLEMNRKVVFDLEFFKPWKSTSQATRFRGNLADLLHDIQAREHFSKDGVAIWRDCLGISQIELVVIDNVDEKLRGRAVRVTRAGHRQRAATIFQAVVGFIGYGRHGGFFHIATILIFKSPTLNHEISDDPVEDRIVEMLLLHVLDKIRHRLGSLVLVEFDANGAHVGLDHGDRIRRVFQRQVLCSITHRRGCRFVFGTSAQQHRERQGSNQRE